MEPESELSGHGSSTTRQALTWAALRLAIERGLGQVSDDDVAAAAGVEPDVFYQYFASKYEAIVSRQVDRMKLAVGVLRKRPAAEPLWQAIEQAVVTPLTWQSAGEYKPEQEWLEDVRALLDDPVIQAEFYRAGQVVVVELAEVIAERTGTNESNDLYPNLVAAAIHAAHQTAIIFWLTANPPVPLIPLLREAVRGIASGLPDPRMSD